MLEDSEIKTRPLTEYTPEEIAAKAAERQKALHANNGKKLKNAREQKLKEIKRILDNLQPYDWQHPAELEEIKELGIFKAVMDMIAKASIAYRLKEKLAPVFEDDEDSGSFSISISRSRNP